MSTKYTEALNKSFSHAVHLVESLRKLINKYHIDLENGTKNTAATYKVNYPFSVVRNIGLFGGGLLGYTIHFLATFSLS